MVHYFGFLRTARGGNRTVEHSYLTHVPQFYTRRTQRSGMETADALCISPPRIESKHTQLDKLGISAMTPNEIRAVSTAPMSTTVLAATLTGIGVVMLILLVGLVVLLVRAVRTHKRLLADLEERGVIIAQTQKNAKRGTITKPHAVLRRNAILPFNARSGWAYLPSTESINAVESQVHPPYYAPPKPAGFENKPKRLSWPFSARRASGKAINLRKIRVPILSTVIESPRPSPLVPVLNEPLGGEPETTKESRGRPSLDQSLLQRHPAFQSMGKNEEVQLENEDAHTKPLRRSLTANSGPNIKARVRPIRSKSVIEIPMSNKVDMVSQLPRANIHARPTSMCSQKLGNAPISGLPPLPLEVVRIKNEVHKCSVLRQSPKRISVSSFESTGSSILATQSSPIMRSSTSRVQKVAKREWRSSLIAGPRPIRDTFTLHGKGGLAQRSTKGITARLSSAGPSPRDQLLGGSKNSVSTNSSSVQSIGKVKIAESVSFSKVSSPPCSPLAVRSYTTPKRKSMPLVTPHGSPEERRKQVLSLQKASGLGTSPKRQLSQASTRASSTRSSNGNPFQWDPSPMSTGKPSALKGSPSARKGHKRQNCVRISLIPTMLGPPSCSPTPSFMNDIQEESPTTTAEKGNNTNLKVNSTRSLPQPPSTSTFAPDLKITATSIRASLIPSSPTLSMVNYSHSPIGTSAISRTTKAFPVLSECGLNRRSTGSIFSIPTFPSPRHEMLSQQHAVLPPPSFELSRPSNEYGDVLRISDITPRSSSSSSFEILRTDEYDPEQPYLVFQNPTGSPSRGFYSPISTIPEEPSVQSSQMTAYERSQLEDSPPCSPKTILPLAFACSTNKLSKESTDIPEEPFDIIDLTVLNDGAFNSLNSPFDNKNGSIMKSSNIRRSSIPVPTSPDSAKSMFEPLIEAAFPSSSPVASNTLGSQSSTRARSNIQKCFEPFGLSPRSSPNSMYSSYSPISSPSMPPCSPRPCHIQLPASSLSFTNIPTLAPSPCGPRVSPPRPLRSSIQKLRRMNSDAENGGRGERRYLRLGREDSIALPGEESWLDELDTGDGGEDENLGEGTGRQIESDIIDDWEEQATILDLQDSTASKQNDEAPDARIEESKGLVVKSSPRPSGPAPNCSSSIWEDGEKFWTSTPPHPPNSPNKPKERFQPLSSSTISTPKIAKGQCEAAKDDVLMHQEDVNGKGKAMKDGRNVKSVLEKGSRYRRRSALGVSTPNVRIQVQLPSSGGVRGTPGSLYDEAGFLRV